MLVCIATKLSGQYPFYKNYNIDDGLVSNKIYNIIEDRYGFIWICSDRGVSRFDGVGFVNFTSRDGLPSNEVLNLFEDSTGRIWFNNFSMEPSYYFNGKIYHAGNDTFLARVRKNKPDGPVLTMIVHDNQSVAFLVVEKGRKKIIGKNINDIPVLDNTRLRAYFLQNILVRDFRQHSYHVISPLEVVGWKHGDSTYVKQGGIWRLEVNYSQTPQGSVFGLNRYRKPAKIYEVPIGTCEQRSFAIDPKYTNIFINGPWKILTGDSLYDIFDDSFHRVIEGSKLPFAFERILVDRKGNKWFGTFDHGIYLVRRNAPVMFSLTADKRSGILAISKVGEELFLQTEKNGLLSIGRDGKFVTRFNLPGYNKIRGFLEAGNHYFVGTDDGILRMDLDFKGLENLEKTSVKDIEAGTGDEVLIGTGYKACVYSNGTLRFVHLARTTAICSINEHTIWSGGLNGIYESKKVGDVYETRKLQLDPELDNGRIVDIRKDHSGNIWVATDQNGVFFCSPQGIVRFSESSGKGYQLLSDVCSQILVAEDSCIWLVTTGAVSVISYRSALSGTRFDIRNFSVSEGMPGKAITSLAFWNGRIIIATATGLYSLSSFPRNSYAINATVITQVNVNGNAVDQDRIVLPYHRNNLVISYASSFINAGMSYLFRYRVRELSRGWIETGTLQVPLIGLEPGDYHFEIGAVNSQGQLGKITTLHFTIHPPWFRRWWFITMVSVLVLCLILYYLKLVKEKISLSKNLALLKLRILRAQMNPHFVFNALSNIQRLIHASELKGANDYLGTLASIMRKSIEYSQKEFIALDKELEHTRNYLEIEKMRFDDRFDYSIDLQIEKHETAILFVPPLLLQPLVENTIKHAFRGAGYKGQLSVEIQKTGNNMIRYVVKDNGCGFDPSVVSADHGLGIARERVELVYKSMRRKAYFNITSHTSQPGNGTTITIELPIIKD